jgi:RNA-binding protein 8A
MDLSESAPPAAVQRGRGRGLKDNDNGNEKDRFEGRGGVFETVEQAPDRVEQQSIEGWIVFVSGVHEEAQEDDILDKFSEFGDVRNVAVNLDRRTGFVKGYALVEFEQWEDAARAIKAMSGAAILGREIACDWAFVRKT